MPDVRKSLKTALSQSYRLRMNLWDTTEILDDVPTNVLQSVNVLKTSLDSFIKAVEGELNP